MAITFTEVPIVAVGEKLKASQLAALADAHKDRVLSGLASPVQRMGYYLSSQVRQLLAPDGDDAFPDDEFWTRHLMVEPEFDVWTLKSPGDPGGANIACPLNAYIHGTDFINVVGERGRLTQIPTEVPGHPDLTPRWVWELAILQAGAYDELTGDVFSPVFYAAQAYAYIRTSNYSQHGNSYGGYVPSPEDLGDCYQPVGDIYKPDLQIFFTKLTGDDAGAVLAFPGTCPDVPDHIAGIAYGPFAYIVFINNGQVFYLPKSEWVEGPYLGSSKLAKQSSDTLSRAQVEFSANLRGTPEQRGDNLRDISHAFRLREFGSRQYALAPRVGEYEGNEIVPIRPTWQETGGFAIPAGSVLSTTTGGATFEWPVGTVCHGLMAYAEALAETATVVLYDNTHTALGTLTLTPDETGHAEALVIFADGVKPVSGGIRALTAITFTGGAGEITVEASAILEYKPQLHDYYLVARRSTWNGILDVNDGKLGVEVDTAKEISDAFLENGVITPLVQPEDPMPDGDQSNSLSLFFQTMRKMLQCYRIAREPQLMDYGLSPEGNSVLWLRRDGEGEGNIYNDIFGGIAPALNHIESGSIIWGRKYYVEEASVTYNGHAYAVNTEFIGAEGIKEFTGDGKVWERDGIRHIAEPTGFTNEWALDVDAMMYSSNPQSIWYQPTFARQGSPFRDRAGVGSPEIFWDRDVNQFLNYSITGPVYQPEMMREHRYMRTPQARLSSHGDHINEFHDGDDADIPQHAQFYRSCRVVEKPLSILTAKRAIMSGIECVRIELDGRLHHHHSLAQNSISSARARSNSSAYRTEIRAEAQDYRTAENAILEWIVRDVTGTECDYAGPGNGAYNGDLSFLPDRPNGACCPVFRFLKLLPKPHLDDNDSLDGHDSAALSDTLRQSDMLLRGMCEGYVDGETTLDLVCNRGVIGNVSVYCFTYTSLMVGANGNRWPGWFPPTVRADNPFSHGPMPNCYTYAQDFNNQARAWNLLTSVPIHLPMTLEYRTGTAQGSDDITSQARNARGELAAPPDIWTYGQGTYAVYVQGGPGSSGSMIYDAWSQYTTPNGVGNNWSIALNRFVTPYTVARYSTTQTVQFRWRGIGDAELALPADVAALLEESPGVVMKLTRQKQLVGRETIAGQSTGQQCHSSTFTGNDTVWSAGALPNYSNVFPVTNTTPITVCAFTLGGTIAPEAAPTGTAWWSSDALPSARPDDPCGNNPYSAINYEVLGENTPIINVPLAAYAGGS